MGTGKASERKVIELTEPVTWRGVTYEAGEMTELPNLIARRVVDKGAGVIIDTKGGEKMAKDRQQMLDEIDKELDQEAQQYPVWDPKEGDKLVGEIVQVRKGIKTPQGENDLISVKPEDGEAVTVWKSTTISELYDQAEVGDLVGLKYAGMKPGEKGNYKNITWSLRKRGGE